MANNVFDCLIEDVEPQSNLVWPTSVLEILENLKDYEGLRTSSAYHGFVDNLMDSHRNDPDEEGDSMPGSTIILQPPATENREMKEMHTNGPAYIIYMLPQPFRRAIMNSALWKWERSQGDTTTACLVILFPKDPTQDVSITLWVGHNEGYWLNDIYQLKHTMSSS
ncbi:hypothetical protein RBB50_012467 [Rhinocladiella similis]